MNADTTPKPLQSNSVINLLFYVNVGFESYCGTGGLTLTPGFSIVVVSYCIIWPAGPHIGYDA